MTFTFFLHFDLGEADFCLPEGAEDAVPCAVPCVVPSIKACIAALSSTSTSSILASNRTAKSAYISIKRRSTSD